MAKPLAAALLRRILALDPKEQLHGLQLWDQHMAAEEFPFFEEISADDFVSGLRRVLDRPDLDSTVRAQLEKSIDIYGRRFEPLADLLPGLVTLRTELVVRGVLKNETSEEEGQDPEEFMAEVEGTLKLFFEVVRKKDPDALITLATNIDRYQEQLEIWINMLDNSQQDFRLRATELLDKTVNAMEVYRSLRI